MLSQQWLRGFCGVLMVLVLSACGGGGSEDGPSEVVPEVRLEIESVKTFRFNWTDIPDATEYRLLESPGDGQGFSPVGEVIEPGTGTLALTVPLYARVNAQYILQACNAEGCVDSDTLSVSGHLVSGIGYFKAGNTDANDSFGRVLSLSADGTTLAVGAIREASAATGVNGDQNDNTANNSGAVYVFTREADTWSQQAYLKASNTDDTDFFGTAVSLSADGATLAVGAQREDSAAAGVNGDQSDNTASSAGAVYVFTREAGTWSQQAYLKASNTDAVDFFGTEVSLSADGATLAVGAQGEDSAATGVNGDQNDNTANNSGAVYVFTREADTWSQQAYLKASNTGADDGFGSAVSLSGDGDTLAVGATSDDSGATGVNNGNPNNNSFPLAGAVHVFTREGGTWSQQAYLKASNTDTFDTFGTAVSLSADGATLAVGADSEDSAATGVNGNQSDNTASSAGAVYVFTREAGLWSQQAYLKASNTGANDLFGWAVSLSAEGDTLAVAAVGEDSAATGVNGDQSDNTVSSAGAVYVFTREAGLWSQQAYLKASNTEAEDGFGWAVSLGAEGATLAVGAQGEDSAATGVNGDQNDNTAGGAGAVYLY